MDDRLLFLLAGILTLFLIFQFGNPQINVNSMNQTVQQGVSKASRSADPDGKTPISVSSVTSFRQGSGCTDFVHHNDNTNSYGDAYASAEIDLSDMYGKGCSSNPFKDFAKVHVDCEGDQLFLYRLNPDADWDDAKDEINCYHNNIGGGGGCSGYDESYTSGERTVTLRDDPGKLDSAFFVCFDHDTSSSGSWAWTWTGWGFYGSGKVVECTADSECASDERCADGVCEELNCKADEVLQNHKCVEIECYKDAGCQGNEVCENNFCEGLECGTGKIPKNHECVLGKECSMNQDCNWCGTECVWDRATNCPLVRPPTGVKCLCQDGACTRTQVICDSGNTKNRECADNKTLGYKECVNDVKWVGRTKDCSVDINVTNGQAIGYCQNASCQSKTVCNKGYNLKNGECVEKFPWKMVVGGVAVLILVVLGLMKVD